VEPTKTYWSMVVSKILLPMVDGLQEEALRAGLVKEIISNSEEVVSTTEDGIPK